MLFYEASQLIRCTQFLSSFFMLHLLFIWPFSGEFASVWSTRQNCLSYTLHILTVKLPLNRICEIWYWVILQKKMCNHFNFHVDWRVLMITLCEDTCLIWMHVCHIPLLHMCVRVFIPTLCMHIHICSVHVFTWRLCTHMPSSYLAELLCCCFDTASHKLSAASNL